MNTATTIAATIVFFLTAFGLGVKHAYDADHLVAVSNILTRSGSVKRTMSLCLSWAMGHMATAAIITVILFKSRDRFLAKYLDPFEIAVGVMLIVIGIASVAWEFKILPKFGHSHRHSRGDDPPHEHVHVHCNTWRDHKVMLGIGVVHGVASNDELLTLVLAALSVVSIYGLLAAITIFTLGVVVGMVIFGCVFHRINQGWTTRIRKGMTIIVAITSVVYGLYMVVLLT